MRSFPLPIFLFFFLFSCKSKKADTPVYNKTYTVGSVPGLEAFESLNEQERNMDSILEEYSQRSFKNNRVRVFIEVTDHYTSSEESAFKNGTPMPCTCGIEKDTITLKAAIGLFGGIGFEIRIFQDHFTTNYFEAIDDVKPFKYNLTDTSSTDLIYLKSKFQSLTLKEKPLFKNDQQLTGYATFTFPDYYTKSVGEKMDTTHVTGSLYFTCKTLKEP